MAIYKFRQPIAIILLLCLIIPLFVLSPMSKANPAVPAIPIAAVAGLAALLGLLGITFTTTEAAQEAAKMASAYDDLWEDINSIRLPPDGGDPNDPYGKIKIDLASTGLFADILYRLKQIFGDTSGTIDVVDESVITYSNAVIVSGFYDLTQEQRYNFAVYSGEIYSYTQGETFDSAQHVVLNNNGVPRYYTLFIEGDGSYCYLKYKDGETVYTANSYTWSKPVGSTLLGVRLGFYRYNVGGQLYIFPYIATKFQNSYGIQYNTNAGDWIDARIPISESSLEFGTKQVPFEVSTEYPQEDIWTSINEIVVDDGQVEIPLKEIGEDLEAEDDVEFDKKKQGYWFDIIPGLEDLLNDSNFYDPFPSSTPLPSPASEGDPDAPYKPSLTDGLPDLTTIWDYVSDFAEDALIWVKLWFSGFVLLPDPLKGTLWALLVISIFTGLLGVFLK